MHQMKMIIPLSLFISTLGIIGCTGETGNSQKSLEENSTLQNSENIVGPEIEFDTMVNSLGEIYEGEQVICYFKYQNTGDEPLVVQSIKAGCGCTVPEWNKEPLQANGREDIKVLFNSSGKRGSQNIRITVNSNAKEKVNTLFIKAEVK